MSYTLTSAGMAFLQALKSLRKEIADEEIVPLYYVFSNDTLIDMVIKKPTTKDAFLSCHKIGLKKYQRYGERFLNFINDYLSEHDDVFYVGDYTLQKHSQFLTKEGRLLFKQLESLRNDYAQLNHIEPQVFLNDETLINFVVLLPYSREEMIRIYGVKREYRESYMKPMIECIYHFTHGQKRRLYHYEYEIPSFHLSPTEIQSFQHQDFMSASEIAKECNRISHGSVVLKATDITQRIRQLDCYYRNNKGLVITDTGERFGLKKITRESETQSYEMILYNKDAQNKILKWYEKVES